jgi:hypothetical protein
MPSHPVPIESAGHGGRGARTHRVGRRRRLRGERRDHRERDGGGTLILRPNSPLHATVFYAVPDTPQDTLEVSTLTLAMPDRTSQTTDFLFPGVTDIYSGGVSITSWTTGIGLGQGEQRN